MPNFITNYELKFWVYKELVIYIFYDFSHKSHTMHLMDYMILFEYSYYHYLDKNKTTLSITILSHI